MKNGYARCSTNESKQDINRQVRELKAAGAEKIFLEYEHGDSKVKSQQEAMFAEAQAGDTIITLEVPRLARSTQQLCEIIEKIREKRLCLVIVRKIFPVSTKYCHRSAQTDTSISGKAPAYVPSPFYIFNNSRPAIFFFAVTLSKIHRNQKIPSYKILKNSFP